MRSPRIVQPKSWWHYASLTALLLGVVGAAAWFLYQTGGSHARLLRSQADQEVAGLQRELQAALENVDKLRQQVVALERSAQIDREANQRVQEDLKKLQDERLALEKEVTFLHRLISEGDAGAVTIRDFKLVGTGKPREYRYSFTVSQLVKNFGMSTGQILLTVIGDKGGAAQELTLKELTDSRRAHHDMKFRHFQNVEGTIRLPEQFSADNLVVRIKPTTKKLLPASETFAWAVGG